MTNIGTYTLDDTDCNRIVHYLVPFNIEDNHAMHGHRAATNIHEGLKFYCNPLD